MYTLFSDTPIYENMWKRRFNRLFKETSWPETMFLFLQKIWGFSGFDFSHTKPMIDIDQKIWNIHIWGMHIHNYELSEKSLEIRGVNGKIIYKWKMFHDFPLPCLITGSDPGFQSSFIHILQHILEISWPQNYPFQLNKPVIIGELWLKVPTGVLLFNHDIPGMRGVTGGHNFPIVDQARAPHRRICKWNGNQHFQWELLANLEFQPLPCLREGTIGIHRSHRYYSYLGTAKFEPFDHFFSKQIINPGCPIAEWPNVKGSQRRRIPAHHRIWAEGMRVAA